MLGLEGQLAAPGDGPALLVLLAVVVVLGLRHATDPDHLAAVTTLIACDRQDGARRVARLGLAWGCGHATTLCLLGLPVVVWAVDLPDTIRRGAEAAVGVVIVLLALRLLARWRSGRFHVHSHTHDGVAHRHLHPHAHGAQHAHRHDPERVLGRTPLQAYAVGLLHGIAGSAGVTVLLLAAMSDRAAAAALLVVFAAGTALSMALLSLLLGFALTRGVVVQRLFAVAPALGALSLGFGVWYTFAAL